MTIGSFVRMLVLSTTLLLSVLLPSFTNGAPRTGRVELDATHVSLPTPLADAVMVALDQRPPGLINGTHFLVTTAQVTGDWAVVSVVSRDERITGDQTTEHEHAQPNHDAPELGGFSKLVVAHHPWYGGWHAALDGTPTFTALAMRVPAEMLPDEAKQILNAATLQPGGTLPKTTFTTSNATPTADNGDLVLDNTEDSFTFTGDLASAACGVGNSTNWTWASSATDHVTNDVAGVWRPNIRTTGQYKVLVHVPSCADVSNLTTNARYEIAYNGGNANVTINQQVQRGWVELGTWSFAAGTNGSVRLTDLTSESFHDQRALMFDAVQWVAMNQTPQPTPSTTPAPTASPTPAPTPPPGPVVNYKFPWPAPLAKHGAFGKAGTPPPTIWAPPAPIGVCSPPPTAWYRRSMRVRSPR